MPVSGAPGRPEPGTRVALSPLLRVRGTPPGSSEARVADELACRRHGNLACRPRGLLSLETLTRCVRGALAKQLRRSETH